MCDRGDGGRKRSPLLATGAPSHVADAASPASGDRGAVRGRDAGVVGRAERLQQAGPPPGRRAARANALARHTDRMDDSAEIVRDVFLAISGGDQSAAFGRFDPEVELDMSGVAGWPERSLYRGSEVREFFQAWADSWQDWHFDLEEVRA